MLFWLPYFSPKSLDFFCIRLLVCFRVISSYLLIEFSFVVLECSVLSVLFYPFRYLFNLPSFANIFWFNSSSCIVIFSCVAFFCSYVFQRLCCVLSFRPVFVDFFICVCSRSSHPGFDFSFVLFDGLPIFLQTNFAPAQISSFDSVILFVDIYVST